DDGFRYATLKCAITRAARILCKRNHIAVRLDCVRAELDDARTGYKVLGVSDRVLPARTRRISISEKAMCPRACDVKKRARPRSAPSAAVERGMKRLASEPTTSLVSQLPPDSPLFDTSPRPAVQEFLSFGPGAVLSSFAAPAMPMQQEQSFHATHLQQQRQQQQRDLAQIAEPNSNKLAGFGLLNAMKSRSYNEMAALGGLTAAIHLAPRHFQLPKASSNHGSSNNDSTNTTANQGAATTVPDSPNNNSDPGSCANTVTGSPLLQPAHNKDLAEKLQSFQQLQAALGHLMNNSGAHAHNSMLGAKLTDSPLLHNLYAARWQPEQGLSL
ncbi:unnamed protein product, partial [Durusdinium trenchii]